MSVTLFSGAGFAHVTAPSASIRKAGGTQSAPVIRPEDRDGVLFSATSNRAVPTDFDPDLDRILTALRAGNIEIVSAARIEDTAFGGVQYNLKIGDEMFVYQRKQPYGKSYFPEFAWIGNEDGSDVALLPVADFRNNNWMPRHEDEQAYHLFSIADEEYLRSQDSGTMIVKLKHYIDERQLHPGEGLFTGTVISYHHSLFVVTPNDKAYLLNSSFLPTQVKADWIKEEPESQSEYAWVRKLQEKSRRRNERIRALVETPTIVKPGCEIMERIADFVKTAELTKDQVLEPIPFEPPRIKPGELLPALPEKTDDK